MVDRQRAERDRHYAREGEGGEKRNKERSNKFTENALRILMLETVTRRSTSRSTTRVVGRVVFIIPV